MSCRPPQILQLPYMKSLPVPSNQVDRYVLDSFSADREEIAAVEIDCSSEVDCCIVTHQGGDAFVAVGSPALGPFTGPLQVKPWRRVMPFSNDGQGYSIEPLITRPPRLALKLHYQVPMVAQARRAPATRMMTDGTAGASYSAIAEFPLFGFASARLNFINGGANSLTYRIKGTQYEAKNQTADQADDPIGWGGGVNSSYLTLDGSGSLELALASGVQSSTTFVNEPWDTLILEVKSAAGSTASGIYYQANGEI